MEEGREHPVSVRESRGGFFPILLIATPMLYVLSPPIVASMLPGNYMDNEAFLIFYTPLILLCGKIPWINEFYNFYFTLFFGV